VIACLVCGCEAGFRFCSSACFLTWARTRAEVECAVCQYDPATGRVGNFNTTRLCRDCRKGVENRGWNDRRMLTGQEDRIRQLRSPGTLADLQREDRRQSSAKQDLIRRLALVGEPELVVRMDQAGRRRGTRLRRRGYSPTEIARVVNCAVSYVHRVLKQAESYVN
jgi:hypothetical protein